MNYALTDNRILISVKEKFVIVQVIKTLQRIKLNEI